MKKENKAILEMLMCAALWSIAGIFIKLIPWNSFVISALRSFFAGLTVLAYIRIKGYRISINRRTIVAGMLLGLVYIAFVAANKLTTAANAIVLQFTDPIFIVIFSALFFGQRFKKRDFVAVIFTFIGIAMFFLDQLEGGYLLGNFVAIFAGACLGGMFIAMGKADTEERFSAMLIGQATAFIFGLPFIITTKPEISALPVLYIVILGVLQLGIPYILYGRASEYCPPLACSLLGAVEPLLNPLCPFPAFSEVFKLRPLYFNSPAEAICAINTAQMVLDSFSLKKEYEFQEKMARLAWYNFRVLTNAPKSCTLIVLKEVNYEPSRDKRLTFEASVAELKPCSIRLPDGGIMWLAFKPQDHLDDLKDLKVTAQFCKVEYL